jgi:Carboxypeptidase regulatory-like domain
VEPQTCAQTARKKHCGLSFKFWSLSLFQNTRGGVVVIRTIIAAIASWSFAGALYGACVLVPPVESSSHVRINVVLGGKPLKGAKVIFYSVLAHGCNCGTDVGRGNPLDIGMVPPGAFPVTDENGIASLPELTPGEYEVAATLNGVASTAFLGLHVISDPKVTTFPMDLTQQVKRIEEVPIRDRVEAFRGNVQDPTGAAIAGANIVVVKKGSQMKDVVLTGTADVGGHFSGQVPEGSYLAVFFFRGFRPGIVPFEVVKGGSSELPVKLGVGGCP